MSSSMLGPCHITMTFGDGTTVDADAYGVNLEIHQDVIPISYMGRPERSMISGNLRQTLTVELTNTQIRVNTEAEAPLGPDAETLIRMIRV